MIPGPQELLGLTDAEWKVLAEVEGFDALAMTLYREIRPDRLADVVHTPDIWLGGHSIVEVAMEYGVDPVNAYLKRIFAYQSF